MITQNLHMHTTWDDAANSVAEMAKACFEAGLTAAGFSVHTPMPYENSWSCPHENLPAYMADVATVKEAYKGKIEVFVGAEWDTASNLDLSPFDYVIGSVHVLPLQGRWRSIDDTAEKSRRIIDECFGGDSDAAAVCYFKELFKVADNPETDIVGHFDIITKFNEQEPVFNEDSPVYRAAAEEAMARLVATGKIFEVNTGAISRGYRTTPYPAERWLRLLREMGGRVTVTADAHHTTAVTCAFREAEALVKACGFREVWELHEGGFAPRTL